MKIKKLIIATFLILTSIILISCSKETKPNSFELFIENIKQEEASFEIVMEVDMKELGTFQRIQKQESGKVWVESFLSIDEVYYERTKSANYKYSEHKTLKVWTKSITTKSETYGLGIDPTKIVASDLEEIDGQYVMKSKWLSTYKVKSFKANITEDFKGATLLIESEIDGDTLEYSLTYSKYGEVSVELPTVGEKVLKTDFDRFMYNIEKETSSYEIKVDMTIDSNVYTVNQKVDGKKIWMSEFLSIPEEYYEKIGSTYYLYEKNTNNQWEKNDSGLTKVIGLGIDPDIFNVNDFDYINNKYVLKSSKYTTYKVRALTIEISSDCKGAVIIMDELMSDGDYTLFSITYSNYGNVSITLPSVS